MKKIIIILATIVISISAFANKYSSTLILQSDNHSFFKAKINGVMYTPINNEIVLPHIGCGTYEVQFYRISNRHKQYHHNRRNIHQVNNQYITVGFNETVIAMLDNQNYVYIKNIRNSIHPHKITPHKSYVTKHNYGTNHTRTVIYEKKTHDRELAYYEEKISRAHFDDDKLELACDAVNNLKINTIEAKHIMELLNFDDARLAFAKYAYTRVIDPENYYRLENSLTFSHSREELQRHVANQTKHRMRY